MIRVVVADDHPVVRRGLAALLTAAPDIVCAGTAASGAEGIALVTQVRPDVLVLDLSMPDGDGVAVIRALREAAVGVRILVLTSFGEADLVVDAVKSGADGYLLKHREAEDVLEAVRAVARGAAPVDPQVAPWLLDELRAAAPATSLSQREREVLALLRDGATNRAISRRLGISEGTVKAHVSHVLQRLGVADRTQAALWAERHLPSRGRDPLR